MVPGIIICVPRSWTVCGRRYIFNSVYGSCRIKIPLLESWRTKRAVVTRILNPVKTDNAALNTLVSAPIPKGASRSNGSCGFDFSWFHQRIFVHLQVADLSEECFYDHDRPTWKLCRIRIWGRKREFNRQFAIFAIFHRNYFPRRIQMHWFNTEMWKKNFILLLEA